MTGWPWPGDNREDKAKRVCMSYRQLAESLAPHKVAALDDKWQAMGIEWVKPSLAHFDLEDWYTARDLAHLIDRNQRDIYDWARRGHIEQRAGADGNAEYLLGSVVEYMKQLRIRRGKAA